MHDGVHLVRAKGFANRRDVGDVALDEVAIADRIAMPCHETVEDDYPIAGAMQSLAGMTADVASPSRHENAARFSVQWKST
jgi:hypothetical protein